MNIDTACARAFPAYGKGASRRLFLLSNRSRPGRQPPASAALSAAIRRAGGSPAAGRPRGSTADT